MNKTAKQTAQNNAAQSNSVPAIPAPLIRILKAGTCPSLSGKSKLSYEVGCNGESAIYFQVSGNSGGGQHNIEWVAMEKIWKALGESTNITSFSLHSVFKGKSLNNGGFWLAALKNEGLVLASEDEKVRSYQLGDYGKFMAEMKTLIKSGVDMKIEGKPKKTVPIMAEVPIKKSASKSSQKKAIDPS